MRNFKGLHRCLMGFLTLVVMSGTVAADPRVELVVLADARSPATAMHEWMPVLQRVDFDLLSLRVARSGDVVGIETIGQGENATYRVSGMLLNATTLSLPGGEYRITDIAGITDWLDRLRADGENGVTGTPGAFGLLADDLVAIHGHLSRPVAAATNNRPASAVVNEMIERIGGEFEITADARRALAGESVVREDLQGMTLGTSLAAVLRPLGLILVPHKPRGEPVQLLISTVREHDESWPVGWPEEAGIQATAPKMLEYLEVEITEVPLNEVLDALEGRLEIPFLYNHNALARRRVNLEEVSVTIPPGRTLYKRILDRALTRAHLTSELRVDEAGRAFLWITTVR